LLVQSLKQHPDKVFADFLDAESAAQANIDADVAGHFPCFFAIPPPAPKKASFAIKRAFLDPVRLTREQIANRVALVGVFAKRRSDLSEFPFWEVLPLWFELFRTPEPDEPTVTFLSTSVCRIRNPGNGPISVKLQAWSKMPIGIQIDTSATLAFSSRGELRGCQEIKVGKGDLYVRAAVKSDPKYDAWRDIAVNLPEYERKAEVPAVAICAEFEADMRQFALEWDSAAEEELMAVLDREVLKSGTFGPVQLAIEQSGRLERFRPRVVLLRAVMRHHFNYIKRLYLRSVPYDVWESAKEYFPIRDQIGTIFDTLAQTQTGEIEVTVDRRKAIALMETGAGDPDDSLISQYAAFINRVTHWTFSWVKLNARRESSISPFCTAMDLYELIGASIFHPTSHLVLALQTGCAIPWAPVDPSVEEFRAIGQWIALNLRSGICQKVSFPLFVWKFIAGEEVGAQDIIAADETVVNGETATMWDGTPIDLDEAPMARLDAIRPMLMAMREGFLKATGGFRLPFLDGKLLSALIIGDELTLEDMRNLIVVNGKQEESTARFWRVFERLSEEDRRSLIWFVMRRRRIHREWAIVKNYHFTVEFCKVNGADDLPTAKTRDLLIMPRYPTDEIAYQQLTRAIRSQR
jgi:hypothetical protein